MRHLLLIAALATAAFSRAQEIVFDTTLGGSKVGEIVYHVKPNGEFDSHSTLKIGPTTVDSLLKGKWDGSKLASWDVEEAANKAHGRIVWNGKTAAVYMEGKLAKDNIPGDWKTQAFMSNYHPQLAKTILGELKAKGKPDIEMVILNAVGPMKVKAEAAPSTVTVDGHATQATRLKVVIGSVEVTYVIVDGECVAMDVPAQMFQVVRRGFETVLVDPLAKYPELSQPTFKTTTIERVNARMRDGVNLVSDIARPEPEGRYPVILVRTPYGRATSLLTTASYAKRGYVVVCQDTRGRGASEGDFDPFNTEVADGKDTLDWLVQQPWCDGNVGMIGGSYLGSVQWAAAVTHHPALKCIIPQVSPPEPTRNVPWDNGCFLLTGNLWWCRVVMNRDADTANALAPVKNMKSLLTLPLDKADEGLLGRDIPFFDTWLHRPNRADWKGAFTTEQVGKVKIPVMHVSGLWDGDGVGTMLHWQAQRANGGNQWMIFGPWSHFFNTATKFGDQDYGKDAVLELDSVYLRFFDTYLKRKDAKLSDQPKVRFFVTGSNRWLEGSDWPLPTSKPVRYFLAGGSALGKASAGMLTPKAGPWSPDRLGYDPASIKMKQDQIDPNPDKAVTFMKMKDADKSMLIYRTAAFGKATTLAGPLVADLFVSTTAKDASFHVSLLDEAPDGKLWTIAMTGNRRVGFVDGKLGPISPNKVYRIKVEPWLFARTFEKGHRLAIMVRSDMFPGFARIPGTGESDATAKKLVKATNTIYKSAKYPSKIDLWQVNE